MSDRNEYGCLGIIYRIDSRLPEVIFEEGFQTWGNNRNFFDDILGYLLGSEVSEEAILEQMSDTIAAIFMNLPIKDNGLM